MSTFTSAARANIHTVACRRRGFLAPNFPSVQEKPIFAPNIHSVHQKPVFCTECFRKRVAYTRSLFLAPRVHSVHQKALSCTEFHKCQKKASIACAECHKYQKRGTHYKCRCYIVGMWVPCERMQAHASEMQVPHDSLGSQRQRQPLPKALGPSRKLPDTLQQPRPPATSSTPPQRPSAPPETPLPLRQHQHPARDKMSLFVFWQMF